MEDTVSIVVEGVEYSVSYEVFGDTLVVTLPDGSRCETELRGLSPASTAKPYLRSYAHNAKRVGRGA
jgi:hypothetical protein